MKCIVVCLLFCALASLACASSDDDPLPTVSGGSSPISSAPIRSPDPPATALPAATAEPIGQATLVIEAPAEVAAGTAFTVTVRIDGATNLGAFQFSPTFDLAVLELVSMRDAGFLSSTGRSASCQTSAPPPQPGLFYCISVGPAPPGPDGSGPLAVLDVRALVAGTSIVGLADPLVTTPDGTEAPVVVEAATVVVR